MRTVEQKSLIQHSLRVFGISLLGITAGFFSLDLMIARYFNQSELQNVYYYSREVTNVGYSIHYFAMAIAGIIFSKWIYPRFSFFRRKITSLAALKISQWSWFAVKVLILAGIPLHILKMLIGRKRPHVSQDFDPLNFDPVNLHHHWNSFPSGHAQVLFTAATVALLIWPKQKYLFLGIAFILALTRVTIHQHYFSDVVAGAAVGYLATLWLHYFLRPEKKTSNTY